MNKTPIVILHGWKLTADKYKPLIQELKKMGFDVIAFDLPGFGSLSKFEKTLTISDYANFVKNRLKALKISKIILVGHSFGGRIGIYLAVNYPTLLKGLVLSGVPALGYDLTFKEKIYFILAKIGGKVFSFSILNNSKEYARKILYKLVGSYDYYKTSGHLRKTFQNIVGFRLESYLEKIDIPTLLIWGKEDRIVPVKVAIRMQRLIKRSKISIIEGARHAVPWTHAEIFSKRIEMFVHDNK